MKNYVLYIILLVTLCGCSLSKYASVDKRASLNGYKYVYILETSELSSSVGYASGGFNWMYGTSSSNTVNPTDVIAGRLMKQGFVRLPQIESDYIDKTLVVTYGESGRHQMLLGYAVEVTIQMLDASTNEVVATTTAAGLGETEADDIRLAILNSLDNLFK